MKIAYLWQREDMAMDKFSGPVLHVRAVIKVLQRHGHTVRLFTFNDGRPAFTDDLTTWQPLYPHATVTPWFRGPERAVRGVQSRLQLPYARLFDSLRFADAILPALRGFDLIYERHDLMGTGGLLAARRLGVPFVIELNGDLFKEYPELGIELSRLQWSMIRLVERRLYTGADHIIVISDALRTITIDRWKLDEAKVSVVKNGFDVEVFANTVQTAQERSSAGKSETLSIIHVGSFQPWHSLDLLVDAFSRLPPGTNAKLMLVGDGPTRSQIAAQVTGLGLEQDVQFFGSVTQEQVARLLALADVAVMSQRPDGAGTSSTPLKLLEYMAAGKAIVAPDMANITAIVQDRESALLFRPGDSDSLAMTLAEALSDESLRTYLGCRAHELALSRYTWDAAVVQIEHILSGFINENG